MLIVGITGPTGAGKSSVCEFIKNNYKAEIIDADKVVKELQDDKKSDYYWAIRKAFGGRVLFNNGFISREGLALIVFLQEPEKKQVLDELTSKYVVPEINRRVELAKQKELDYIIVDAPTLIENNMQDMFDKIIVVTANPKIRLRRICKRDNIIKEFAESRMEAQPDEEFYLKYADFVISNDNSDLDSKVRTIFEEIGR